MPSTHGLASLVFDRAKGLNWGPCNFQGKVLLGTWAKILPKPAARMSGLQDRIAAVQAWGGWCSCRYMNRHVDLLLLWIDHPWVLRPHVWKNQPPVGSYSNPLHQTSRHYIKLTGYRIESLKVSAHGAVEFVQYLGVERPLAPTSGISFSMLLGLPKALHPQIAITGLQNSWRARLRGDLGCSSQVPTSAVRHESVFLGCVALAGQKLANALERLHRRTGEGTLPKLAAHAAANATIITAILKFTVINTASNNAVLHIPSTCKDGLTCKDGFSVSPIMSISMLPSWRHHNTSPSSLPLKMPLRSV